MKTIFALVLAAALSSCTMVVKFVAEEPKVELKSVGFTKLSLSEVKLNFEAEVENPNKFELGLDRMEYDVLLSESRIGSGTFTEGFKVAAESRGVLKVPFSLDSSYFDWRFIGTGMPFIISSPISI